jgi:pimeloyl-ACP methyl ester carboxylesterase
MADPRIVEHHRLISFDLPWHGKSPPPEGAIQGSWRLNTDLYVALIMGFIAAAGLKKPVALGASMSGEICLELAYRHPDSFAGIIACEACDKINQRQTVWAAHPHVNQAQFVPEWIRALSAPRSPANTWNRSHGTMARVARRCSLATSPSTPASGMPGNASGVSIPTGARFLC